VFFLHGENELGKVILREKLTRERLLPFLPNQPVSTIAIEAGCGAHHWGRAFTQLGHQVRLIHAKFVRPFVTWSKAILSLLERKFVNPAWKACDLITSAA
jgi:transposase